ncbi:MAG: hypothetical protein ACKVU4_11985 [Phycisphaerales bacterium]
MRRAFTMIEGIMSTVIVGVMMVAAMQTVAASRVVQFKTAERAQAALLAGEMMTEVMEQGYEDAVSPVFGPEGGESTGTRASFDDVDDYHGWEEKPVETRAGVTVVGLEQWTRAVSVMRVAPGNLGVAALTETGAKRITVTIKHRDVPVFTLNAVRTSAR